MTHRNRDSATLRLVPPLTSEAGADCVVRGIGPAHASMRAWAERALGSLAELSGGEPLTLAFKGTVLLRPRVLHALLQGASALVATWRDECRFILGRTHAVRGELEGWDLDEVSRRLGQGRDVVRVELRAGEAAEEPLTPVGRLVLGGKARTLDILSELRGPWRISRPHIVWGEEWALDPDGVLRRVRERFGAARVVVRSSASAEDAWTASNAGRYLSVLDVDARDTEALARAISDVFGSYEQGAESEHVFLQDYIHPVEESGVLMTRHPETLAPYWVVASDRHSGRTDQITSGASENHSSAYVEHGAPAAMLQGSLRRVVDVGRELVELTGVDALDIEFAMAGGDFHLLQVRPIAEGTVPREDREVRRARLLTDACTAHQALILPERPVVGDGPVYSTMTDWNPAEMIGRRPLPLARSLYGRLITDETWATQRAEYGYRDLRGVPLLRDFAGHAYVDVRASLNSFIPAVTPAHVADTLVSLQLARLAEDPRLHDKVEFDIADTCTTLGLRERLRRRYLPAVEEAELDALVAALRDITLGGLRDLPVQLGRIERLRAAPFGPGFGGGLGPVLAHLRELGTLPFAHLARTAFVVTAMLKSFVREGILDAGEQREVLQRIRTVAGQLQADALRVKRGELGLDVLVAEYGHLRPGTYDIRVPRYATDPERYFGPLISGGEALPRHEEPLSRSLHERIGAGLREAGLEMSSEAFLGHLEAAIAGREYGKHVFTRTLSGVLEHIATWGELLGLGRDALAYLSLEQVEAAMALPADAARSRCRAAIDEAREQAAAIDLIELPDVVGRTSHLLVHVSCDEQPLFVTRECVRAPVLVADGLPDPERVRGIIVLLERADPGYDSLLALGVAGIVTAYGGANSHMAVRCTEMRIPAAIGVGREQLRRLASGRTMTLDCGGRRLVHE
ncbi:sugar metabolism cluster protein [Pyxidicoccus fallax]|uniref:Sugar metabolism cluster protein n=1 Tax=Pyxidicoccus fallax TaxID=394095 RepID=A0A848LDR6_9BACT|nr:PEP-utilizing enzyme [Pyxidicoccus fallax]NMO16544.1 sugar metabolism cluster protein [Pyxidicoccus fallax]NPC78135.1 sugar metabolism cluster protein [Pyxidicoccus fallax]